ncbi:hypothetical protein [Streptomyces sp. NPDC002671]
MLGDLRFSEEQQETVFIEGSILSASASDFMLDAPARRSSAGGSHRRALVHDTADGLTINFNGDYPGGVSIVNAKINLSHESGPNLPKHASTGDIRLIKHRGGHEGGIITLDSISLWLCTGFTRPLAVGEESVATWQQIQLGDEVKGTA